jgi:hypothetical protein
MIAAACHCPDTVELDEWLPHWVADYLYVPDGPDLGAKMAAAIACAPGRLSAEEVAELLPTTFDDRQWMKLWTFGACDMTPHKAYTEIWRCGRTDETDPARLAEAAKELASIPVDVIVASRIKSGRFSTNSLMRVLYLAVPTMPTLRLHCYGRSHHPETWQAFISGRIGLYSRTASRQPRGCSRSIPQPLDRFR